jgi:hypothetical protein
MLSQNILQIIEDSSGPCQGSLIFFVRNRLYRPSCITIYLTSESFSKNSITMISKSMETENQSKEEPTSLEKLVRYFLYLGTVGFGGPAALVGFMHRELAAPVAAAVAPSTKP